MVHPHSTGTVENVFVRWSTSLLACVSIRGAVALCDAQVRLRSALSRGWSHARKIRTVSLAVSKGRSCWYIESERCIGERSISNTRDLLGRDIVLPQTRPSMSEVALAGTRGVENGGPNNVSRRKVAVWGGGTVVSTASNLLLWELHGWYHPSAAGAEY